MAHAPLIYSGMNYGLNYVGVPYSGIAMMILFCMTIGIYMSFVTLKTNNCMYASIIHGAVNIIGETPIFISLSTQSVLLGPNPSGIIGMSVLLIGAILLLFKLPSHKMNSWGDFMCKTEWILCPVCGSKTRDRIREDTILKNYPLYCPKCKQETLIKAENLQIAVITEPDT